MKFRVLIVILTAAAISAFFADRVRVGAVEVDPLLEQAMYKRQRFFGADAIVPLPAAEAFANLQRLRTEIGDDPKYLEKTAVIAERLGDQTVAEDLLTRLANVRPDKTSLLGDFYARRGMFDKQAEVWAKRVESGDEGERPVALGNLLSVARRHGLRQFLSKEYLARVAANNAGSYAVFEKLIENEYDPERSLELIRGARAAFDDDDHALLKKEIETLRGLGRDDEAEKVYLDSFDPFWDADLSREFYDFLSERDRLRAYGRGLRERFRKEPSNFDAAIRYAHFCNYDFRLDSDTFESISKRLEAAKTAWTTDELVTVTRMLIRENNARDASRFLYTLVLRDDFKIGSAKRGQVLYQLFEMFADAGSKRIPLARGDLRFYSDVARADTDPGILTGILSLLFADTKPGDQLDGLESKIASDFNRAAAYRVFLAFRQENPASTHLAQMYLDLIRLYAAKGEAEVAGSLLAEFAANHERSENFPLAAIKLADAYAAKNDPANERATLQRILDHFGAQNRPLTPEAQPSNRNSGIDIPKDGTDKGEIKDFFDRDEAPVTYAEALDRIIASYSRERKTAEIIGLYANEIGKYPDEQWLYERRLTWLETAGLTDDQLATYRAALARFQTRTWQDKFARFLIRQKRKDEFADLASDLAGRLNESEATTFLTLASTYDIGPSLALSLYKTAHERFPRNTAIVEGLMRINRTLKNEEEWRRLAAESFFESASIRNQFLDDLAKRGELRGALGRIASDGSEIAELFRAEAASRLSDFESAAVSYAKLDRLYPATPEFNDRLIELTRSFGQRDRSTLGQAATLARGRADRSFDNAEYRTIAGEIFAETGRYKEANAEWQLIIKTASGEANAYLDTASVMWDYYQYNDALNTIEQTRAAFKDKTMFAFEAGSIRESLGDRQGSLREFVAALNDPDKGYRSREHLAYLAKKSRSVEEFDAAYQDVSKKLGGDRLAIAYGQFLDDAGRADEAERLIVSGANRTDDADLLADALSFFKGRGRGEGTRAILRRISATTKSARRRIENRIAIAESLSDEERKTEARDEAIAIVRDNPTNYGAIVQASDFLRRAGFADEASSILREALAKSRGRYKPALAKKLADTLAAGGRPDLAAAEITRLHTEDPGNTGVFEALIQTAIRAKDVEGLRRAFDETLKALRAKTTNKPLLDARVADLRTRMIDAFTRLEDFDSAIDQYIELINREPSDEELTESAIKYTTRRGGGARLLAYYERLSAESFKNYRWNVVLARLRAAAGDQNGAIAEYDKAIVNQPAMHELQLAAAGIEIARKNYGAALTRIDKALELTNDEPSVLRRKIEVLKLAGRTAEIDAVRAKLPAESDPSKDKDKFDAARRVAREDREKAREIYRKAFEELRLDPLSGDPKAADLRAYADAVRGEVSLADINLQLWDLRTKLAALAGVSDTNRALEARRRQSIIETALVETVGAIAATSATDAELAALHDDLRARPDAKLTGEERAKAISIVRDMSRRCGFGDIEEALLIAEAEADPKSNLSKLLDFYQKRGAYQKASDAAARFGADAKTRAASARLVGDRAKELAALREIYEQPAENAELFDRYFELLLKTDSAALGSLASSESKHPFALINFFVRRGMADEAHRAVDAAKFDNGWKIARHAQIVYALSEKGDRASGYFDAALRFAPIGRMIALKTDADELPTGEDWFRIASDFGRWRFSQGDQKARTFLSAMTEGLPSSSAEQQRLGVFFMKKNDFAAALERFRLAIEIDNSAVADAELVAAVGAAQWKLGNRTEALAKWNEIVARKNLGDDAKLIGTLSGFGLADEARKLLAPVVAAQAESSDEFRSLIESLADSFDDEDALARYFLDICGSSRRAGDIAEVIADRVKGARREPFLAIIIRSERDPRIYDFDYEEIYRRAFRDRSAAEAVFDHENGFKVDDPDSQKFVTTRDLLDSMVGRGGFKDAEPLLSEAETWIDGKYPRPVWMRAMRLRIDARNGVDVLAAAERFVGIDVPDAVIDIQPPDLERFNLVKDLEPRLAESFYARRLALGIYDAANFVGLATAMKDRDGAKRVIELMAEIAGDGPEQAAREIAGLEAVKSRLPDPTRYSNASEFPTDHAVRLRIAAETGDNLGDARAAAVFRKLLAESPDASPADRVAYAKSIVKSDKATAMRLLIGVVDSFETTRSIRWQARSELERAGFGEQLPDISYDAFSQFYQGVFASGTRKDRFINSLLADPNAVADARPELVKAYGRESMPFAALELAKSLAGAKSDELLDVLSAAAESIGDFDRALEFERARKDGGRADRIAALEKSRAARPGPATDLVIDSDRTTKQ
ncbi:MAG: hypothetical protein IPN69_23710 [Acidobacteria bacterium]|nr:hypothetical protein [Acidobacteriota bacterium]